VEPFQGEVVDHLNLEEAMEHHLLELVALQILHQEVKVEVNWHPLEEVVVERSSTLVVEEVVPSLHKQSRHALLAPHSYQSWPYPLHSSEAMPLPSSCPQAAD
jgi:hypothetical protein